MGMFSMTNNFDNEVEILKSRTLIKKVVNDLNLYVRVAEKRAFGYAMPLYKNSPVRIYMTPEEADKLEEPIKLDLTFTKTGKLSVKAENVKPLLSKVNVIFFPIAFLNINSEPQGSTILASKEPWKKYDEQHEHFRDPEFRGIRYDLAKLPDDLRNKVWTNTKLHRRAGCRAVPYGVFKNSKGEYKPFDENLSTEELAALFEVKL